MLAEITGVGVSHAINGSCGSIYHHQISNIGLGAQVYNGDLEAIVQAMEYAS